MSSLLPTTLPILVCPLFQDGGTKTPTIYILAKTHFGNIRSILNSGFGRFQPQNTWTVP